MHFNIDSYYRTTLHRSYTNLSSHQMCMRVGFPHTHRELVSVMVCITCYVKNDVTVFLITISTIMAEVEHVLKDKDEYDLKRNQSMEHVLRCISFSLL